MAAQMVKLKAFSKFENTTEALAAATALVDSKLGKGERNRATHGRSAYLRCMRSRRRGIGRCMQA